MKGFLRSKFFLTSVAFVMITAAVIIPFAGALAHSHAASPNQTTKTYTQTFNMASCSSSTNFVTVVPTLNKGDVVSGTATLTSNDSGENTQSEDLTLLQPIGSFTQTITINNSPQNVSFTETVNGDSLQACIQDGADGPDSDQTATITVTVTTSPQPPPTPTPTPPVKKTINIGGNAKQIFNQVADALHKYVPRLKLACTLDLLGNEFELLGLLQNGKTLAELDFKVILSHHDLDQILVEGLVAAIALLPGEGCAEAIVNLGSAGGIDLLKQCLGDRGCLTAIENDKVLKREFCVAAIDAIINSTFPLLFPILTFEENQFCGKG